MRKTIAILIPAILAQATGNVCLSMTMKEFGGRDLLTPLLQAMGSPALWFGTALLVISLVLFAAALSWADLSFVLPAVSLEVAVNVIFANYFLREVVSLKRWTGVLLITIGVLLVLRSERQKAKREREAFLERGLP